MTKWSSRWFLMSVYGITASIVLSLRFGEPSAFIAITSIALGGGHFTNIMERRNGAGPQGGTASGGHTPGEPAAQARPVDISEGD